MMPETGINFILSIHSAVMFFAVTAYYKVGDRTKLITESLQGTDKVMSRLKYLITTELIVTIRGFFSEESSVEGLIVSADGAPMSYEERPTNMLGSTLFQEAILSFINDRAESIADYRTLSIARWKWNWWSKFLSRAVISTIIIEGIIIAVLGVVIKGFAVPTCELYVKLTTIPVTILVVLCLLPLPFISMYHNRIMDLRIKHDGL